MVDDRPAARRAEERCMAAGDRPVVECQPLRPAHHDLRHTLVQRLLFPDRTVMPARGVDHHHVHLVCLVSARMDAQHVAVLQQIRSLRRKHRPVEQRAVGAAHVLIAAAAGVGHEQAVCAGDRTLRQRQRRVRRFSGAAKRLRALQHPLTHRTACVDAELRRAPLRYAIYCFFFHFFSLFRVYRSAFCSFRNVCRTSWIFASVSSLVKNAGLLLAPLKSRFLFVSLHVLIISACLSFGVSTKVILCA